MIESVNVLQELNKNYILVKDKKYKKLYKKFSNRFDTKDLEKLLKEKSNKYIDSFIKIMNENGKEKYMENFYSNLNNSKLIKSKYIQKLFLEYGVYGGETITKRNIYLILGDKINLEDSNATLTPYHELLHLLSTRIKNENTVLTGFKHNNFGEGINEGYTELLTKRYFGHLSNNDKGLYDYFTWFSSMIEEIVGKEKLEEYYFNSNIEGLFLELIKYVSINKIETMICNLDRLFDNKNKQFKILKESYVKNKEIDINQMEELYLENRKDVEIIYYLIKNMYINKQRELLKNNKITEEDYNNKIGDFNNTNDKIKAKFEKEDEVYLDYYKYEAKFWGKDNIFIKKKNKSWNK